VLAVPQRSRGEVATACWQALGTTVVVCITAEQALAEARVLVEAELDAIDRACSRFRADSELELVNASAGRFMVVGPLLLEALDAALRAAWLTDGAVDPTLGEALVLGGYSRDWSELTHPPARVTAESDADRRSGPPAAAPIVRARRASGWRLIEIGHDPPGVRIPAGVRLDLGATAKALAADRAAAAVHAAIGEGVLVTDDHRAGPDAPGQTIAITSGALATSSTTVRRWLKGTRVMHHILDPSTGEPVRPVWRTASVAASSCVDANIASTAALVQGRPALRWLSELRLPSRLVSVSGEVHVIAGWPPDPGSNDR